MPFMTIKLADIAFLGVVTIFIPILPIPIETQPLIALFFVVLRIRSVLKQAIIGDIEAKLIFTYLCIIIFYTVYGIYFYGYNSILTMAKVAIPLLFFLALQRTKIEVSESLILVFCIVHLLLLIQILAGYDVILSAMYNRFSAAKGGEYGNGISFFSYEPGYGAMYIFAAFVAIWAGIKSKRRFVYCYFLIILIILTKSAFGFILAAVSLYILHGHRFILKCIPALPIVFYFLPDDFRILQVSNTLISLGEESDWLSSLILLEPSGMTRLLKNIPSIYYGFLSVFGFGVGSFETEFSKIAQGIELYREHPLLKEVYESGSTVAAPDSFLSLSAFEMGFFSLLYVVAIWLILVKIKDSQGMRIFTAGLMITVLFTLQSQISSPILLYVLYCLAHGFYAQKLSDGKGNCPKDCK